MVSGRVVNDNWLNVSVRSRIVRGEIEALQAVVDRVIPIRDGLSVLVGEVAAET